MTTFTLLKYNKTQQQEDKLMQLVFSEVYKKVTSRAVLTNDNLLVKATDINGREDFKEMDRSGVLIDTFLYF